VTSKEVVKRTIKMQNPPRVPLLYFNCFHERSDILSISYETASDYALKNTNISEWGLKWETKDDTMGQPSNIPLPSWDELCNYQFPVAGDNGRFDHIPDFVRKYGDKYLMGGIGISGFSLVTMIRGFADAMEDLYVERENIEYLLDRIQGFEMDIIRGYGKYDLDAVSFGDDWGSQNSLLISPVLWREFYKPRLKKQFDLIHSLGMDVYFHSCGNVYDIIPDLIEIGADILNFNQPDLFGIEKLGHDFGGKVCFNCPVDHQTVAVYGTPDEIFEYVSRLYKQLGSSKGGFIGYIEEYHSIGMSNENFAAIIEAFENLSK